MTTVVSPVGIAVLPAPEVERLEGRPQPPALLPAPRDPAAGETVLGDPDALDGSDVRGARRDELLLRRAVASGRGPRPARRGIVRREL